ncbi:hypothetical protein ACIPSA_32830 [Streptomyces sp. NPDC086549]|uniref:hypothetical protein n=1 Tax=Streptomyces sp. NPDC086549 TaxID=3365752 RepID=UPI00381FCC70
MWPGEQPPGSGTQPQHNPYRQPGYQQPNPYVGQQQPAQWAVPTAVPPPQPDGGGRRTKLVAVVAAAAVVVTACVTGFLVLGGGKDDEAGPGPTASPSSASGSPSAAVSATQDNPRGDEALKPTVTGWKVVVNPDVGIAFDVPADWAPRPKDWITYVTDDSGSGDKVLVGMKAPAVYKEKWCSSDDDKNGRTENTSLASVGTRGNDSSKSPAEAARADSADWVYGWYAQPDRKKVTTGPVTSYTTASGITGSLATSRSSGVVKQHKCDSDGTATTFAFKDPDGSVLSWSFVGATGVSGAVPESTVRDILRTVRLYDTGSDS